MIVTKQTQIVIDDERTFDFPAIYCRTSDEGLAALARAYTEYRIRYGTTLAELWLDHDLGGDDTIGIVVDFLCAVDMIHMIDMIYVHSQNPTVSWIVDVLVARGYKARRYALPKTI